MDVETRAAPATVRVNCRGCNHTGVHVWDFGEPGQLCTLCSGTGAQDRPAMVLTATTQFTEYKGRALSRVSHVRVPGILPSGASRMWTLTYDQFLEQVREAKVIPWPDNTKGDK